MFPTHAAVLRGRVDGVGLFALVGVVLVHVVLLPADVAAVCLADRPSSTPATVGFAVLAVVLAVTGVLTSTTFRPAPSPDASQHPTPFAVTPPLRRPLAMTATTTTPTYEEHR